MPLNNSKLVLPHLALQIHLPCWAQMLCSFCPLLVGEVNEDLSDGEYWKDSGVLKVSVKPKEKELPFKKVAGGRRNKEAQNSPDWLECAFKSKKSSVFSYLPGPGEPGHEHPARAVLMLQCCLSSVCLGACRCGHYVPPQPKRESDSPPLLCLWRGNPGNAVAIQGRGGLCWIILRCISTVMLSAPGVWRLWVWGKNLTVDCIFLSRKALTQFDLKGTMVSFWGAAMTCIAGYQFHLQLCECISP